MRTSAAFLILLLVACGVRGDDAARARAKAKALAAMAMVQAPVAPPPAFTAGPALPPIDFDLSALDAPRPAAQVVPPVPFDSTASATRATSALTVAEQSWPSQAAALSPVPTFTSALAGIGGGTLTSNCPPTG